MHDLIGPPSGHGDRTRQLILAQFQRLEEFSQEDSTGMHRRHAHVVVHLSLQWQSTTSGWVVRCMVRDDRRHSYDGHSLERRGVLADVLTGRLAVAGRQARA